MRRSASKTLVEETVTPGVSSPAGDPGYRYQVSYSQARSEIRLKRVRRTPDTRSERHRTLQNALDLQSRFLPDAKVSVISHDVDGRLESGYRITFKPGIGSGDDMFQTKMSAALITLAGEHETGKMWDTRWRADKGTIELYLKEPLPTLVRHPVWKSLDEVGDGDRFHIPYATGEGGKQAFWNVSSKSTNPHSLIIGPTGGGKALDTATEMPTPTGWTTMGELRVGDTLFDERGAPCRVTGVYDQPLTDNCYKVTFSDGSSIVADGDHQWFTHDRNARISQAVQSRATATRTPWLSASTVRRLRAAAKAAPAGAGITIVEAASLAGVNPTGQRLHRIAKSLGPIRVDQKVSTYRYAAQEVVQQQRIRIYNSRQLTDYLEDRVARARAGSSLAAHAPAVTQACATLRSTGELTTNDIASATGVKPKLAREWLQRVGAPSPIRIEHRPVTVTVPERAITRPGTRERIFGRRAFLTALADQGEQPMRDQRQGCTLGQVRSTDELRATLHDGGYVNHSIPVAGRLDLPDADLPVAPYTFGAWLGDGTSSKPEITSADPEIVDRIRRDGYPVTHKPLGRDPHTACRQYRIDNLRKPLSALGVMTPYGERGTRKRIPTAYLRASERQRRELLAGLLDTDGTVGPGGAVQYTSVTLELAAGVTELALSLGYRAVSREGRARLDGRDIGPKWTISFTTTDPVFELSRKNTVLAERTRRSVTERNRHRYITSIDKVAPRPTRCITVDSPRSLFLAGREMIPTHNTSLIRTIMVECALRGIPMIGVDPKEIELDGMDDFPGVISVITQARRSAQLVRALADETAARNAYMRYHKLDPSDMPLLVIILDEFFILSGQWTQLAKSGDEETKNELNALDPLGAIGYLAALARSSGIRLCVGVQRPDANIFGKASGNVRDNFKTRVSLASLSQDGAMMMWGDASIGRELDASVPGRAMVTDLKGDAMLAQVWWTPNVDPHPKRRGALDTVDRNLVEALTPTVAPEVECYSASLAEFLENERALKSQPKPVPEPVRFGSSKTLAEIDDALPASVVAVGAEVLIPASDDPDSPLVTGTVQRTHRDGMNTVLAVQIHPEGTARPATVELEFTPGESVFLADVDTANATAAA